MRRLSRFGMALLLLNLSLVGQELACAHEAVALEQPAGSHHADSETHHDRAPAESDRPPCDASSAQCCDALASCAVAGVPQGFDRAMGSSLVDRILIPATDLRLASTPLEVATPPPRA